MYHLIWNTDVYVRRFDIKIFMGQGSPAKIFGPEAQKVNNIEARGRREALRFIRISMLPSLKGNYFL